MSQFALPKRYDDKIAKDGVWVEVYDELDQHWGNYKVGLFNLTAKHVRDELDKWNRNNKANRTKSDNAITAAFVEIALVEWEKVNLGPDGAEIPFSKKAALELLTDEGASFLVEKLLTAAGDVRNFAGNPEAEQEEDAKN